MIELIGWCGSICQIIGLVFNAHKKMVCWPVWLLSNVFLCIYSITLTLWPVFALNIVFVIFNIYGWRQWAKKLKR